MIQENKMDASTSNEPPFERSDLEALRESIAEVLMAECNTRAVHAYIDGECNLDELIWTRATELGWLAIGLPEEFGGLSLGASGLDILYRQIGRFAAPGPFAATLSAAQWILDAGTEAQKEAYLPAIASGKLTVAVPACFVLNGGGQPEGSCIQMLGAPNAGLGIVPVAEGWALVHTGMQLKPVELWDRTRSICSLSLEGLEVASRIEDPDGAMRRLLARHLARALASDCIGASREIASRTLEYLKNREQFGQVVALFQAIKHRIANIYARIELNEHLVAQAVEAESWASPDAELWALLAKADLSEMALWIGQECLVLHGGVGFTWDFDPHIYLKRARLNEMLVATNAQCRDRAAELMMAATTAGRTTAEIPAL
jgi:alkylation response protein AidB-like acyl-CoA dehydrogenase